MQEKIPYWRSSRFWGVWVEKNGVDGCVVCLDAVAKLSDDRAPPRQLYPRLEPTSPVGPKKIPPKLKMSADEWLLTGIGKMVDAARDFDRWLDTPPAPKPDTSQAATSEPSKSKEKIQTFYIQEIPAAIRALGMPKAAAIFDRWFSGGLNYSVDEQDAKKGLNQFGQAYHESMVDTTSISLDRILDFDRARIRFDFLKNKAVYHADCIAILKSILAPFCHRSTILSEIECGDDMELMHKKFQFQLVSVDGSFAERLEQYVLRETTSRGMPDELSMIFGSFNFYAAVGRATFDRISASKTRATVTHIWIYAKDSFSFTDQVDVPSQYLGHWNKTGVAIVPMQMLASKSGTRTWVDHPVFEHPLEGNFKLMYPVKNSDFRSWQQKHKRGGDFLIYSNRMSVRLSSPISVEILCDI